MADHNDPVLYLTDAFLETFDRHGSATVFTEERIRQARDPGPNQFRGTIPYVSQRSAESALAAERAKSKGLVAALKEARTVLALCGPSRARLDALRDRCLPEDDVVRSIAHLGYGAIMDAAARLWCDALEAQGLPWGAAHSTGPCVSTALVTVAKIDAALSAAGEA